MLQVTSLLPALHLLNYSLTAMFQYHRSRPPPPLCTSSSTRRVRERGRARRVPASPQGGWEGFQSGFRRDRTVIKTILPPQCDRDPRGRPRQNGENSGSHHGRAARATSGRKIGKQRETRPTAHLLQGTRTYYSNFVSKVPEGKQMLLFTYVRLAHGFSDYKTRLKSVQVVITVLLLENQANFSISGSTSGPFSSYLLQPVDRLDPVSTLLWSSRGAGRRAGDAW